MPEFTIERKSIKQYEMQALDAIRLDRIFKLETKEMSKKAVEQGATHNPYKVMAKALDSEVQGRKFRFEGIKTNDVGGKGPGGAAGGKSKSNKNDFNKSGGAKSSS